MNNQNEESKEEWRQIEGYEYWVSNKGRVKNKKNELLKPAINTRSGYKYVILSNNGVKKNIKVHILVSKAFIANPNDFPELNHIDCNKTNNNVVNLEWVTCLENNQSKNKTTNIGYIRYNSSGYQALITIYKIRYSYYNKKREEVEKWLEERRVEIKNNDISNLKDYEVKEKEKKIYVYPENMEKGIKPTNNGKYDVAKKVCGKSYKKRFETYEEAKEYLNELIKMKEDIENNEKEKQNEKTKNNEIKKNDEKEKQKEIQKETRLKKRIEEIKENGLGCVISYRGNFKAKFGFDGKIYTYDNKNEKKCYEWLAERKQEILNGKEITYNKNTRKIKEGKGSIYKSSSNTFILEISIEGIKLRKTLSSEEEAETLRVKLNQFKTYQQAKEYVDNINKPIRGKVYKKKDTDKYTMEIKFNKKNICKTFDTEEKAKELRIKLNEFETYEEAKKYVKNNY